METLQLRSRVFEQNRSIPPVYTCQGKNVNPPLAIAGVLEGTKSFALVMDDPDAPGGTWDHWVVWNIPPDIREIVENSVPAGSVQGINSSGESEYQGPCPPSGTHRYRFTVYALSGLLSLAPGSNKQALLTAIQHLIIDQCTLTGFYKNIS